jgi:HK97 family phage major capsid protein
MNTQELIAQHDTAFAAAETLVATAERQKRNLTSYEQQIFDGHMKTVSALKPKITAAKSTTSKSVAEVRAQIDGMQPRRSLVTPSHDGREPITTGVSREYLHAFRAYLGGAGAITGSLQEGASISGGFVVPTITDQKVVPLAPQDSAVRQLATVIETSSDVRVAAIASRGTVSAKAESSAFSVATPTMNGFTLSAFANGVEVPISMELAQDAPWFNKVTLADAVSGMLEAEEVNYVTGSGSGQAQGLIGNVGAGITAEPDNQGNLVSIDAIWQVVASLKDSYAKNASFLMSRATALGIRRAQITSVFEPVLRRVNGQDECAGHPVFYSSAMPAAARGACPVLFGDFSKGYLIGDRGGSALIMKKLDQTSLMMSNGELVLLFYRRSDGRVRIAEAIQALNVSAS